MRSPEQRGDGEEYLLYTAYSPWKRITEEIYHCCLPTVLYYTDSGGPTCSGSIAAVVILAVWMLSGAVVLTAAHDACL